MENVLGSLLKSLRASRGWTLRDVSARAPISTGYLSLLEQGKIQEPSPHVLSVLAELYGAAYEELMRAAGYPWPGAEEDAGPAFRFAGEERLSPADRAEIQHLIDYKLSRSTQRRLP